MIFHSYARLPEGNNPLFCGTPIKAKQRSASGQIVEHQGGKPKSLSSWSHQNRKGRLREHSDFFFCWYPWNYVIHVFLWLLEKIPSPLMGVSTCCSELPENVRWIRLTPVDLSYLFVCHDVWWWITWDIHKISL